MLITPISFIAQSHLPWQDTALPSNDGTAQEWLTLYRDLQEHCDDEMTPIEEMDIDVVEGDGSLDVTEWDDIGDFIEFEEKHMHRIHHASGKREHYSHFECDSDAGFNDTEDNSRDVFFKRILNHVR